jgi:hypothetical protein
MYVHMEVYTHPHIYTVLSTIQGDRGKAGAGITEKHE